MNKQGCILYSDAEMTWGVKIEIDYVIESFSPKQKS